ncbi:unnamed protein product [Mytilus edulis]|uniref:Alpha-carbonic anhydrase domain-containing protein n=1 Tax=Mytilus edulis TaxID=6550 RepID=A0A8S3TZY5_MYTED|nr:unnamed protein product [Mytilus edulis]
MQKNAWLAPLDLPGHGESEDIEHTKFNWFDEKFQHLSHLTPTLHNNVNMESVTEMHVVMHSDRFQTVTDAMNVTNGLAVLGFFIDVGDYNDEFESIIRNLRNIKRKDSNSSSSYINSDALPFFTYRGMHDNYTRGLMFQINGITTIDSDNDIHDAINVAESNILAGGLNIVPMAT